MNRSLIAAAALAVLAPSAMAQAGNVTIYGLLDQGIIKGNGGTATNPGGLGTSEAWTLGQASTSRLGVRGNEDLGGGLSAQFQIEHRFNPDTGSVNSANSFWNGRSYVQLTSTALLSWQYTIAPVESSPVTMTPSAFCSSCAL